MMDAGAADRKLMLIERVKGLQDDRLIAKLLKLIEREQPFSPSPEQLAYWTERVIQGTKDGDEGRVKSHDEVVAWMKEKKRQLKNAD